MKTIIVIGGMGSGKSSVVEQLHSLGAATIDLDLVGHEALELPEVIAELVDAFGEDILDGEGRVTRKVLAGKAFRDEQATKLLSGITLPYILTLLQQCLEAIDTSYKVVVIEASAFDGDKSGYQSLGDYVIAVTAPEELRVARLAAKGFEESDARRRIAQQPTDQKRESWADFVLDNTSTPENLRAQVEKLWERVQ